MCVFREEWFLKRKEIFFSDLLLIFAESSNEKTGSENGGVKAEDKRYTKIAIPYERQSSDLTTCSRHEVPSE